MISFLTDLHLWIGFITGGVLVAYFFYERRSANQIGYDAAVKLSRELQTAYRNEDLKGIEKFKEDYLNRNKICILEKKEEPCALQLWSAILIYVAHRYADYDFNEYDSEEWKDIVAKTFGNKSIAYTEYCAVEEILNRSTKYYLSDSGWTKQTKNSHGAIRDYGDDALYGMVVYIIKGSCESTIEFGEYKDVDDPEDAYDRGSYALACIQLNGNNNLEGIKNLEKAALSGMPEAQCRLGLIYSMGERVIKNDDLAFRWFMKSAENDDAMGMFFVGQSYYNGSGCGKDLDKAIYWIQKSAEKGQDLAQDMLGVLCLNGEGTEKDVERGIELITKAANQNFAHSQYVLAVIYARGIDRPFDREKALYWIDKAISSDKKFEQYKAEVIDFIRKNEANNV